ncbi:hypothetical protein JYQ62_21330 [Nostoc sp. UHCC 0702]|nr:hypothetical protein JYQ62_21330 [Nostoc sp. UHCC 0702]
MNRLFVRIFENEIFSRRGASALGGFADLKQLAWRRGAERMRDLFVW